MSLADDVTESGKLKYLIHTKVGEGPRVILDPACSLLNPATGLPVSTCGTV